MAYEQRDNSGTLFFNNKKEKETHADWNGTALIDGKEYYLNAWEKQGKNGKFFSLSIKQKGISQQSQHQPATQDKPDIGGHYGSDGQFVSDDAPF